MAKKSSPEKTKTPAPAPSLDGEGRKAPADGRGSDYVVFARRFRPRGFSDVVGQTATTSALRQALKTGRIAQAYLFCGPRGVGKTSLARIVAKALNCRNGSGPGGMAEEPCNECETCQSIQEGSALDVIEMDAATNRGIEEVRTLRENVSISPAEMRYKVYIIDEVHMLTREAWNAFLKTLEEPPAHVKFIFATTDPNNVPETILSRCQRYDLRRIGPADIVTRLKQICALDKIEYEEAALSRIAALAKGGLRDAEGLLDQCVNLGEGKATDAAVRELSGAAPDELISEMLKNCAAGNTAVLLGQSHQALEAGADPEDVLSALIEHLRGTVLCKVCGENSALLEGHAHLKSAYAELGKLLSEDQLLMLIQLFTAARRQLKDATQTRLPLEMALVRAARAGDLVELGKLVSAVESNAGKTPAPQAREGPRPNLPGRPAGIAESRPAATVPQASSLPDRRDAGGTSAPQSITRDIWQKAVDALAAQKGGAMLASALTFAHAASFDAASSVVTLGFLPHQFYREIIEKAENKSRLLAVLGDSFGRPVTVVVERVEAGSPRTNPLGEPGQGSVARTSPSGIRTGSQQQAARGTLLAEPEISEEAGIEETEVEFDGAGELPLPAAPASEENAAPAAEEGEDPAPAGRVPALQPKAKQAMVRDPALLKKFESHPLVKMVLKETGGVIIGVTKK